MIIKERTKPVALRVLEALHCRSSLMTETKREYWTQIKGYEGEKEFDKAVEKIAPGVPVLNDLMLKDGSFISQVNSLMIIDNTIRLFEIKNMTGEYTYVDEALHSESGLVYTSPVVQMRKTSSLIQNLIRKNGLRFEVISHVVFTHPNFYIYNLPKHKAFIFSYKIEEHLRALDRTNYSLQHKQKQLIDLLMQHHQENYRSNELPTYEYSNLKKGIYCPECFSFEHTNTLRNRICHCGFKETTVEALVRSIEEYSVLFPNDKITVSVVYDWLDKEYDKQKIQRALKTHFQVRGENKGTYYC